MKITAISVYKTDLPYVGGSYGWGRGNAITTARASARAVVFFSLADAGCALR